jgi:hypothetical protein
MDKVKNVTYTGSVILECWRNELYLGILELLFILAVLAVLAVSAVSTLTLTVTALEAPAPAGSEIWYFGTVAEAGGDQTILKPTASTRTQYTPGEAGLANAGFRDEVSDVIYNRSGLGDPMIVHSNNATAAGIIEYCAYGYFAA